MIQRIKELEEREEVERQAKVVAGRKLLEQVMLANNAQARAKLRKKEEEVAEDMRIAEYIRLKDLRDSEVEAEQNRIKSEKEREVARLRAMQERAQDRQSAIDELRAKRYQEQKDRQWRQKQLEETSKRDAMKGEIAAARDMQRQEKSRRMAEQALQEREEYLRVLEWQTTQAQIDEKRVDEAASAKVVHREQLLGQMREHSAAKADARARFLAEGQEINKKLESDKRKLQRVKAAKLEELEKMGVPEKYRAQVTKKKLLVASIHAAK